MASQGEREPGGVVMCCSNLEAMVQDEIPMQDIPEQDESLPQTNPKPEMGAAAAASDTPPPHLRQSPSPLPSEATTDRGNPASSGSFDMNQVGEMLMGMRKQMDTSTNKLRGEMKEMGGEMRQVGQCLQAGKMATPRAATNELGGVQRLSGPQWRRVRRK